MKRTLALVSAIAAAAGIVATVNSATLRSGTLHVTKECPPSQYLGRAGDFCTITSSNIDVIKPGSRIFYASAIGDPTPGMLDSDLVIDGPGNNTAFGHVWLNVSTIPFTGRVTLSGGTGVFAHFHAELIRVACPDFPVCTWDGSYSFSPPTSG